MSTAENRVPARPTLANEASDGRRLDLEPTPGSERAKSVRHLGRTKTSRFGPIAFSSNRQVAAAARSGLLALAGRIDDGLLVIRDVDGGRFEFGRRSTRPSVRGGAAPEPTASIEVRDERAWLAVAGEGSIGLGRGYIEGWWHSDDPTAVVQVMIRNLRGLDELRNRVHQVTGRVGDVMRRALPSPSRERNREDIGAHYDLSNDFFRLFLDPTMTYSSGIFETGETDLEQASRAKYDRLLAKLGIREDHHILEIGTGWGGLAIRAAEQHGAEVTTTTVSSRQLAEARARAAASAAADRIEVLGRDWRDLSGRYQRIVSIEMIEAVDWRDYDRFFATIERCLAADGMVGLQAICVPDRRWSRTKNTEDFIRRFVFPGGFLPSIGAMASSVARSTRLQVLDVEDFTAHYAETLRQWRTRFDAAGGEVARLGLDERFRRLWRFYLAYCEAGFLERHCTVNQVVLVGPDWRPDGLALRPH